MDNLANTRPAIVPTFRNPPEHINADDPCYNPFAVLGQNLDSPAPLNPSNSLVSPRQQTFIANPSATTTISLPLPPPSPSALPPNPSSINTTTFTTLQGFSSRPLTMRPLSPTTHRTDPSNLIGVESAVNPLLDVNFDERNRWITQRRLPNRSNARPIRDEKRSN
eukprot:TRINITY_DN2657_c0_g1_i8.p1 TRINITY_DN2657_c0_g1~~TRINITY_DN2657_c0_g1_i8.p1  ORF type:complete len:165 (-),score=17.52 TRINITY_DN2657_c0_g1_i8:185-679(-)